MQATPNPHTHYPKAAPQHVYSFNPATPTHPPSIPPTQPPYIKLNHPFSPEQPPPRPETHLELLHKDRLIRLVVPGVACGCDAAHLQVVHVLGPGPDRLACRAGAASTALRCHTVLAGAAQAVAHTDVLVLRQLCGEVSGTKGTGQ